MTSRSRSTPGTTRTCPHCRTTILDSANICPACRSYLRFDPSHTTKERATVQPLRIDGTVRHTAGGEAWEYNVIVTVTNERGEEVGRHVVGVGSLKPEELRQVSLAFEIFVPEGVTPPTDLDVA